MKHFSLLTALLLALILNSCKKDVNTIPLSESHLTSLAAVSNGLLSYYTFNGNAKDSITHFEGIVHDAVLIAGKYGMSDQAYCFKDSHKYISLPHGIVADSLSTYAVYVRFKADSGTLIHSGDMSKSGSSLEIINKSIIYKWNFHGYLSSVNAKPNVVKVGEWNDLVVSVQNQIASVYLNGVIVTGEMTWSPSQGQHINSTVPHFGIAKYLPLGADLLGASFENGKYDKFLDGAIDELRFYNRSLSTTEVAALANK